MKKAAFLASLALSSLAHADWNIHTASTGPVTITLNDSDSKFLLELSYTGALMKCGEGAQPEKGITAIFTFDAAASPQPIQVRLNSRCPTPWTPDTQPQASAFLSLLPGNPEQEFLTAVRTQVLDLGLPLRVFFVDGDGHLDQNQGGNHTLEFSRRPGPLHEPTSFHASAGPTSAWLNVSFTGVQFNFIYTGHLYQCRHVRGVAEGNPITAVFVFGTGIERYSIERKLTRTCTQPWAYNQPNVAQDAFLIAFDAADFALWSAMREQIFQRRLPVEVAFVNEQGEWDSNHGRNYSLEFSPSR